MSFDEILDNDTSQEYKRNKLVAQALKRQEYNRQYQKRLRQAARFLTLERKIEANLDFVIRYIKKNHSKEYSNYVEPVVKSEPVADTIPVFDTWLLLSASEYKSVEEAYELSRLNDHKVDIKEFTKMFEQYYKKNNKGKYIRY